MRSVAIGILVRTGSGDEVNKDAGISHFIEHMMFKGTPTRSAFQIAKEIDAVGGKINAGTGKESTVYYCVILDEHMQIAIDVLQDIFLNSLFDQKEIDLERKVILEEIRMYEDTPDELIHDLFAEAILSGHPMGRPTIGTAQTVGAMSKEGMLSYIGQKYKPENIIITVAGNVEHEEIVSKFEPLFGKIKKGGPRQVVQPAKFSNVVKAKKKKTEQVHICVGAKAISQLDSRRYSFMALDNILGGSMSSRLFQEVREKRGLAYSIYSYINAFRDFGFFCVYAGSAMDKYKEVIEIILKELGKIKKEGLTEDELKRAKEYVKSSIVLGLESTSSRMGWVSRSEFYYDRILSVDEVFGEVDKIGRDDIIGLANEYFRDENLALALIGDFAEEPRMEMKI